MDQAALDQLFRSFSDPARRGVLRLLGETPLTVGEVTEVLGLPQSTVSRHLKTLRNTGLLVDRREGNRVYIGLIEPDRAESAPLGDLLNAWIRQRPLGEQLASRLQNVLKGRNGQADVFDRLAHQWDDLRFRYFGGLFHLEALLALLPAEWDVLDMGSGTGFLLPALSRQFRNVIAIDPSPEMLRLAQNRAKQLGLPNVDFKSGRLEEIPLEENSVDAALVVLALRHTRDLAGSSSELYRILKNRGQALIVDVVSHADEDFKKDTHDPTWGIDRVQVCAELETAGFAVLQNRSLTMPPADHPAAPRKQAPELFLITTRKRIE